MSEVAYRITKARYFESHEEMFSGAGAALHGGRWNSRGRQMIYASDSRALATLEILVRLRGPQVLDAYSVCEVLIPDKLCEEVTARDLPDGWSEIRLSSLASQSWGDIWLDRGKTPVVKVPSVVVPREWNYLINPRHEEFDAIQLGAIEKHPFDARIAATRPQGSD